MSEKVNAKQMEAKLTGSENTWASKSLSFTFMTSGFGEQTFLKKWILRVHLIMIPINIIYVSHTWYTATIELKKDNLNMVRMVFSWNNGVLITYSMVCVYSLMKMRRKASWCFQNPANLLHSASRPVENRKWKQYVPTFKFLLQFYAYPVYLSPVGFLIISPLFRFVFQGKTTTYVVYPLWYPVDVLSSRKLFWIVYVYESMICMNCCKCVGDLNVMLVYSLLCIRIRFEMLGEFFTGVRYSRKEILSNSKRIKRKRRQFAVRGDTLLPISETSRNGGPSRPLGAEMFKKGFEDWNIIWRQFESINSSLSKYKDALCTISTTSMVGMAFASFIMLQKKEIPIWDRMTACWLFAYLSLAGLSQLFVLCYLGNLLETAHKMLWTSIWSSNWSLETEEVQKLLCMYHQRLSAPLTMRALGFVKVNFKTCRKILSTSYSLLSFLGEVLAGTGESEPGS